MTTIEMSEQERSVAVKALHATRHIDLRSLIPEVFTSERHRLALGELDAFIFRLVEGGPQAFQPSEAATLTASLCHLDWHGRSNEIGAYSGQIPALVAALLEAQMEE